MLGPRRAIRLLDAAMNPTRLDLFIFRTTAQRACIDEVARARSGRPGLVLEIGLGNGRTYDHLRSRFPGQEIHVFDREVAAHPDCIPPSHLLHLGDFRQTIPTFLPQAQGRTGFIHADVGSADRTASTRLANELAPVWLLMLDPDGFLACDQAIDNPGLVEQSIPGGDYGGCYHLYRRRGT